jgi:hypothetical protein
MQTTVGIVFIFLYSLHIRCCFTLAVPVPLMPCLAQYTLPPPPTHHRSPPPFFATGQTPCVILVIIFPSVVDPHHIDAHPDPTFHFNGNPDADPRRWFTNSFSILLNFFCMNYELHLFCMLPFVHALSLNLT